MKCSPFYCRRTHTVLVKVRPLQIIILDGWCCEQIYLLTCQDSTGASDWRFYV